MSLNRYIAKKFGTKTKSRQNPLTPTVATTVTQILRNNPDRLSYTIVNLTAFNLYCGFDREVSSTRGIFIPPSGGSLTLTAEEDGELVGYELFAISAGSPSTIFTISTEGE